MAIAYVDAVWVWCFRIWEFPKIRGTLFWGPYNKDPTIQGTILGPLFSETPILAFLTLHPSTEEDEAQYSQSATVAITLASIASALSLAHGWDGIKKCFENVNSIPYLGFKYPKKCNMLPGYDKCQGEGESASLA